MKYKINLGTKTFLFKDLKDLLAKASFLKSADVLAGIAAESQTQRVMAQKCLADLPLKTFLDEEIIPCASDEISRLILQQFDEISFKLIAHHTLGSLRDWLLESTTTVKEIAQIKYALTPEMVAALSKIMRNQDLILAAKKCEVITKFRSTIGLDGHLAVRLQPNHPVDDPKGIAVSILDGLLLGAGDAVIGINPASDSPNNIKKLAELTDRLRTKLDIPTQSCILTHITTQMQLMKQKVPIDLVFQSIGGTQKCNEGFGINLSMLKEAHEMVLDFHSKNGFKHVMYFETGQGSALSSNAHHGVDAQTCEVRAYAVAREYSPFLVNTVVGFIGPEYLYNGKQITRAGLEDHFCGKILGLPMGCDVCYTNHADADQNDMDNLLCLLSMAGCSFVIAVPGCDDIMLNYQTASFHDVLFLRTMLKLKPAPEFFAWLKRMQIMDEQLFLSHKEKKLLSMVSDEF